MSLVEKSVEIVLDAYRGQTDKAGRTYILHPLLMTNMDTPEEQAVALLHDVNEDSDYTLDGLSEAGISRTM